jgi:hypothetical protein
MKLKLADTRVPPEASVSTVRIPLVGAVTCRTPMLARENVEAYVPVSTGLATRGSKWFLIRGQGDLMNNAGIQDKDIPLLRQQEMANNGDDVVALIDDEASAKLFEKTSSAIAELPLLGLSLDSPVNVSDHSLVQLRRRESALIRKVPSSQQLWQLALNQRFRKRPQTCFEGPFEASS